MESIIDEMARRYNKFLESLIEPLTQDQILCVHHISQEFSIEEKDKFEISENIRYHVLNNNEVCVVSGKSEQYMRA